MRRRLLGHTSTSYGVGKPINQTSLINDPALRAYYQFQGNGNDYFGTYNAITANNVGYNSGGKFGRSATFSSATGSYFRLPDAITYNQTQTISFWAFIENQTTNFHLFGKGSDSTDGWGMNFRMTNSSATYVLEIVLGATVKTAFFSYGSGFKLSEWKHYAIVVDFTNLDLALYVNGSLLMNLDFTGVPPLRGTTDVYIGAAKLGTVFNPSMTGEISDWALFERRLTDSEIQHLALGNPIA